ncbi:hypothetical protein TKK_0015340 [Trichogramma kaykai]|uniref:DUF7041 domain-containing protein n=1 Tax=Trichogramma kaykai TaxID=54128 RepID=A0ABD2WBA6_9HYME
MSAGEDKDKPEDINNSLLTEDGCDAREVEARLMARMKVYEDSMVSLREQLDTVGLAIEKLQVAVTSHPQLQSRNLLAVSSVSSLSTSTTDSTITTSTPGQLHHNLAAQNHQFKFQWTPSSQDPGVKPFSQSCYEAMQFSQAQASTTPTQYNSSPIPSTGLSQAHIADSNSSGFFRYRPVEVPAFWHHDPASWFELLESEFEALKILDDRAKYGSLLKSLGQGTCKAIASIIKSLPPTDKYSSLKESVIRKYSQSAHQKIDQLFKQCSLGDKKPSELLTEMQALGRDHVSDETLMLLWVRLLPSELAVLLDESVTKANAPQVVAKADRLHERLKSSKSYSQISSLDSAQDSESDVTVRITNAVLAAISAQTKSDQRPSRSKTKEKNSKSKSSNRSKSKTRYGPNKDLCYYHSKYGKDADFCSTPPCAWEDKYAQQDSDQGN